MKQLFVITWPEFFPGETELLERLFEAGLARLHLRKPGSSRQELRTFLAALPAAYYPRIVLHDHFELIAESFPAGRLGGLHLNRRHPLRPRGYAGSTSCSCHSLAEVAEKQGFDYVFLSPIFPSISKQGYGEGFPPEVLLEATRQGQIHERVIALGGISARTLPRLANTGFGGVAVLGALWGAHPSAEASDAIIQRYKILQQCL